MLFSENLSQAFNSVRANALRATLTLLIIAFGIMALVGILTAIDALLFTMNANFSRMGANSFDIRPGISSLHSNREGRQEKEAPPINFRQAQEFKERYDYSGAMVSVSGFGTWDATVKYGDKKTNPTVLVFGIDENYLKIRGYDLEVGRNFTNVELEAGTLMAIVGMEVVNMLFDKNPSKAINKEVTIDNRRFTIIGVLKSKGSAMGQSADNRILIPLIAERYIYSWADKNYTVTVSVPAATEMEDAVALATGVMRNIRKLRASEENDFETFQSDSLMNILKENTAEIRFATIGIGLITLIGAA